MPTNTAPTISDQSFSIAEEAPVGTSLGTIVASDADEDPLTFSISNGNMGETFQVDSLSGELKLSGMLDFSMARSYTLFVQVSDGEGIYEEIQGRQPMGCCVYIPKGTGYCNIKMQSF